MSSVLLFKGALNEKATNHIIVICAYNEEENLRRLLRSIDNRRAVLVDDGSTDLTSVVARSMGFTVLEHSHRLGKTTALRDGLDFAREKQIPITVVLDADALPEPDA
ncbi:MAG: glycosyltransferase, partial [Thaumarchaeota archaeon]|nr:glycosyltransferase [Nitrososphaerota archaeon]